MLYPAFFTQATCGNIEMGSPARLQGALPGFLGSVKWRREKEHFSSPFLVQFYFAIDTWMTPPEKIV